MSNTDAPKVYTCEPFTKPSDWFSRITNCDLPTDSWRCTLSATDAGSPSPSPPTSAPHTEPDSHSAIPQYITCQSTAPDTFICQSTTPIQSSAPDYTKSDRPTTSASNLPPNPQTPSLNTDQHLGTDTKNTYKSTLPTEPPPDPDPDSSQGPRGWGYNFASEGFKSGGSAIASSISAAAAYAGAFISRRLPNTVKSGYSKIKSQWNATTSYASEVKTGVSVTLEKLNKLAEQTSSFLDKGTSVAGTTHLLAYCAVGATVLIGGAVIAGWPNRVWSEVQDRWTGYQGGEGVLGGLGEGVSGYWRDRWGGTGASGGR